MNQTTETLNAGWIPLEPEFEDDERCEVHEGEDRCPNRATREIEEPYTPGRFKVQCCDGCARSLIHGGYIAPMSLDRVEWAIKENYKAAATSQDETWYFDGLLTVILARRDAELTDRHLAYQAHQIRAGEVLPRKEWHRY